MSDKDIEEAIRPLEAKLETALAEVKRIKNAINCYCEAMGQPVKYPDVGQENRQGVAPRADEYYGRPLASVVAEVLEKRKESGLGAATLDQIFTELSAGGFKFEGKSEGIQKRGLAITMGKNTAKFHKLPNETWGLREWYKILKEDKDIAGSVNKLAKGAKSLDETVGDILSDSDKEEGKNEA